MARKKPADVFVLDLADFQVSNIDFYASIQDRLRRVGEEFSTFAQALWGKQVSNFLDSSPGNDQMDNSWQPVRALGKGGFGLVGLWEKTNRKGVVVDSIAIKEMERHPNGGYHLESRPHLAREAVIMKQLNDAEQGHGWRTKNNILRLRSFKYFPSCSRWRFYLEYAPNGDLHKLIYSYRAWDTYLPEEFLWHVFHSLAKVAVVMEQGPFTDLETEEASVGQMIHLDVKPDNLYMGKPDNMALFAKYPTIKMADFGLSELTFEDDQDNPQMYRKGTTDYLPPVSVFLVLLRRWPLLTQSNRSRHALPLIGNNVLTAFHMIVHCTRPANARTWRRGCKTLDTNSYQHITSGGSGSSCMI